MGAHATLDEAGTMTLTAFVGRPDGGAWLRDTLTVAGGGAAQDRPVLVAEIPVGTGPVSVKARTADEVWVVNEVSDSVSIVSLSRHAVIATLRHLSFATLTDLRAAIYERVAVFNNTPHCVILM